MTWFFRPILDLFKFVFCHALLVPLVLSSVNFGKLLPPVDRVTTEKLNVRADSSLNAPILGYLKKNQEIDIVNHGANWIELDPVGSYYTSLSLEERKTLSTGHFFVSAQFVESGSINIWTTYFPFICVVHVVCYIFLLIVGRKEFFQVLWFYLLSTHTIPLAFQTAGRLIKGIFQKKSQLTTESA